MTIDTTNIINDFGGVLMKHDRESRLNGLRQLILEHVLWIIVCFLFAYLPVCAAESQDSLRAVDLPEVVATGTRSEADPRLLPMTVSVISQDQLEERSDINILPTLTTEVPGLFVTQRGVLGYGVSTGGSGGIKVRGIGGSPNTDILVLIDGLPQYAGLYGHPIADNYQTMLAERVEVIRGPASLFYGSNAMGGVINIVTRQPKNDTIMTDIHARGGSYYTVDAGISNQLRKGKYSHAAGFNYSRTKGHRERMGFDEYNGFVRLGYELTDHWRIGATGNVAYFNSQNPGTVDAPVIDNTMHILRGTAALSVENQYDKTSGAIRLYYSGGHHTINDGYAAAGGTPQTALYHHTDFMAGVSVYQSVALFRGNRTTFGFDYQHFGGHAWNAAIADGTETDIIRKAQYELAGYIDFRQQITSWLALDAGIRFDWHSQSGIAYIPQGGLSFLLPHDAEIKALVSRGFRNPTIRELYMYKPANDSLRAENVWNYELSYRQYLLDRRIRLGVNIFYLHATNMIVTQMTAGKPKNINTGEMKNCGLETEFAYNIVKGLWLSANYSFLHMSNPQLGAPEHKLNIAARYHHDRFRVGTDVQYIHGLHLATGAQPEKENYVLWNAHASVRLWRGLWANITVDTILGQQYEINKGFPMPGTSVLAGLRWSF